MICDQEISFLSGSSSLANHGGYLSCFILLPTNQVGSKYQPLPTMFKLSTFLLVPYFVTYLSIYEI